ncbi:hypothetical protein [Microcella sp.]|uniref:hypothetical protein n=1 Tax=Microcella sp. TaxID=1913979 RepID=UPI00391DFBE1
MSFFDRLFGASRDEDARQPSRARSDDARAVERYRYLLQTAPPEAIKRVHREAFERLTPEQRALLLDELRRDAPEGEQPADDRPDTLARAATRAEMRDPGSMERTMQAPVFGQVLGASLLGTVAGYVVGSALVSAFLPPVDAGGELAGGGAVDASGDAGTDFGADFGGFGDFGF